MIDTLDSKPRDRYREGSAPTMPSLGPLVRFTQPHVVPLRRRCSQRRWVQDAAQQRGSTHIDWKTAAYELRELRVVGCQPPLPGDHQRARRRSGRLPSRQRAGRRERGHACVGRREELGEWLLRQPRRPGARRQRRQRAQHEDPRAGAGRDHPRAAAAPPPEPQCACGSFTAAVRLQLPPPFRFMNSRARSKRGDAAGTGTYASPEPRGP